MPFVKNGNTEIHYEEAGQGDAVILIAGLAADCRFWFRAVPMLQDSHRVIVLDNRGCGLTKYKGQFSVKDMSEDVVAVMDALSIDKAHVLGWSMGSHIAMYLAADHPDRVNTLTVVSSYLKEPMRSYYILKSMQDGLSDGTLSNEMAGKILNTMLFGEDWFKARLESGKPIRTADFPPAQHYADQMNAVETLKFNDFVDKITVPVLSVHGLADIMTPPETGDDLAQHFTDCTKIRFPGEGHSVDQKLYIPEFVKFIESH